MRESEPIQLTINGVSHELDREQARGLRDRIDDSLTQEREFLHTAGKHREDGKYVVSRRCAESTGNEKVFDNFDQLCRMFERLPAEFTAEQIGRTGITGSRRHMLVRHFAEHPGFDCTITRRNPLTVKKTAPAAGEHEHDSATAD